MYAKDGDAVRLDVNDEARRGARRTECVSGVVGGEWSSLRTAERGLCSRRGACGTTTSDKDSVDFELLRTSDHTGLILTLAWRLVTKQWF
jgi:hypothetical protein